MPQTLSKEYFETKRKETLSRRLNNPMVQEDSLAGKILRNGLIGQRAILEEQLRKGIPLVMADEKGRLFQENPDGTFEYIEPAEQEETSCGKSLNRSSSAAATGPAKARSRVRHTAWRRDTPSLIQTGFPWKNT